MKLNSRRIILLVVVVAALVLIARIPKSRGAVVQQEETVYTVRSQIVERKDLQEYLTMNGSIRAENTISVYPDISGKIIRVYVSLGSTVRRGDTIAEIDPSTPGSVYAASPVYAPIAGSITSLPLTPGTSVSTSTAIATIGNISRLQIMAQVPERDIAVLKTGLSAEISLEAYPGETFSAHVFRVSPIVDETSRTKEIWYVFDSNDERINAGMYAKIKLNTVLHEDAIVLPTDAVLTIEGKSTIYVINADNTVTERQIETGVTVDSQVEVLSGLKEGERVVTTGIQSLADGVKIRDIGV